MSTLIQINVTNNSPTLQNFFFFQQPAIYTGGPRVYSNSLLSTPILPFGQSGSVYTFLLELQYYAGVQQQFGPPVVGEPSGYMSAMQPIDLTPAQGAVDNNCTTMQIAPALGLSTPVSNAGVQPGAFRIVSPAYDPSRQQFNGGSAVQLASGKIVLSNFITVQPSQNLDCQPILQFYVGIGNYTSGTVMNFTSSSVGAAMCDATDGYTTFNVTYNPDGSWTVVPSNSSLKATADAQGRLSVETVELNTNIKNEAGTQIICRGHAAGWQPPFVVDHLTVPAALHMRCEYQVGPDAGPYKGRMISALSPAAGSATFS